jgi:ATP-dependent helicase/nuclease subunit A
MANVLAFPQRLAPPAQDDTAIRDRALDTRSSCIVEAPAGSGKTGLLVQRFLKLLAEEDVAQPSEILAVTFTNKATAELRERVLEQLQAAHHNDPLPPDAPAFQLQTRSLAQAALTRSEQQNWQLLERPQQLNIRSIDSVCAEIANGLPLLSGGGRREPLPDARALYRQAARRTLLQLGSADTQLHNALHTLLLHRDGSLFDCEALLAGMLATREQWGDLVPLNTESLEEATLETIVRPRLERALERIVCDGLSRALNAMPADLLTELTALAARMGLAPGYKGGDNPIALCATRLEPPAAAADHLEHWRALISLLIKPSDGQWRASYNQNHIYFEIAKADAATMKQWVAQIQNEDLRLALHDVLLLPPAKYPDEQWVVAKSLFHVLRRSLAELKVLFADRNVCDFTEFSLAAREALRSDEASSDEASSNDTSSNNTSIDLALSAGGRLRHLLVDEMQDTSSGQYELIELLTRTWDGHTQTVFLVGDPKQSIYLFRQARVERFLHTMERGRFGDIRLESLRLTANFRSQAVLVDDFNAAFELLFPSPAEATQQTSAPDVPFVAATASRKPTQDNGIVWHTSIKEPHQPDPRTTEAATIRIIIEARLSQPLPEGRSKPWSIAVLARARTHLAAIVAEFKRNDGNGPLAFRAVDIDPLDELPEVLDALALTRALLHPSDRIAWLAVLHAPWCGLSLADLLTLTDEGPTADATATVVELVELRSSFLSDVGQQLLARSWPILQTALRTSGTTTIATQVERAWLSLGADRPLTDAQHTNVTRFLAILRELEEDGGRLDLNLLQTRLTALYAEPAAGNIAVELMTIHKAKGLEWDVVFVPGLERGSGQNTSVLLNWLELDDPQHDNHPTAPEQNANLILAPIAGKGGDPSELTRWLNRLRAQRERAEEKRLFYVASTRAREELHLFATAERRNSTGELKQPRFDTLLKACWPAAVTQFDLGALQSEQQTEHEITEPLALAAAATATAERTLIPRRLLRLPLSFDPAARFAEAAESRLDYASAAALRQTPIFDRPEGSFAVRAFGNVVHRYLQVVANLLAANHLTENQQASGAPAEALLAELPTWTPRLTASLRSEGLPPADAAREANRARTALTNTLSDPAGRWLLSPHPQAASESSLTTASLLAANLRVDRTFLAGPEPLTPGDNCLWIIDFKTTEQGSRTGAAFEAAERTKYTAQLEAYANLRRSLPDGHLPFRLGLYYPLIPRLLHWLSEPATS